jgi:hypothetical protein
MFVSGEGGTIENTLVALFVLDRRRYHGDVRVSIRGRRGDF